jgi:hypothetical protein
MTAYEQFDKWLCTLMAVEMTAEVLADKNTGDEAELYQLFAEQLNQATQNFRNMRQIVLNDDPPESEEE